MGSIKPLTPEQVSALRKLYSSRISKAGIPPLTLGRSLLAFDRSIEAFQDSFSRRDASQRCHLCLSDSVAGIYAGNPRRWICSRCLNP